ncbi:MAG: hypothetical protein SFZ02_15735 [bacterium]|nr:hypothetical protein [bacterium]
MYIKLDTMTFPEIIEAVTQLSNDELAQLQQVIYTKQADAIPDLSLFETFSNDQLWDVIRQPFNAVQNIRLHQLTDQNQMGKELTHTEQQEVNQLIQAYDRFILIRSMAMVTLQKRGVDVMISEMAPSV